VVVESAVLSVCYRRSFRELRIMTCHGLYDCAHTGSGHSKDESPAILRVEVGIGQEEVALIQVRLIFVLYYSFKYISGVKLLTFCVLSNSGLYTRFSFHVLEGQKFRDILFNNNGYSGEKTRHLLL
jgi:hypothetical protein